MIIAPQFQKRFANCSKHPFSRTCAFYHYFKCSECSSGTWLSLHNFKGVLQTVQNIPFLALVHFYHYFNCSESSPVPVDDYCSTISKAFCKRRASNGGVKAANHEEALHSSVKWVFLPQFDYHKAFEFWPSWECQIFQVWFTTSSKWDGSVKSSEGFSNT